METIAEMSRSVVDPSAEPIPTALYRHFNAAGELLYVGISLSPTYRMAQHRGASSWFREIARVEVEWLPNRAAACEAERAAIQSENPAYNKVHRLVMEAETEDESLSLPEASRIELVREFARYRAAYTVKDAADAIGITEVGMRLALLFRDIRFFDGGCNRPVISGWSLIEYMEALEAGAVKVRAAAVLPDGRREKAPSYAEIMAGRMFTVDELANRAA